MQFKELIFHVSSVYLKMEITRYLLNYFIQQFLSWIIMENFYWRNIWHRLDMLMAMFVFIGARENNFSNSVTGYDKNNKDEQKTIVKTIFDPCEKSFKNLWQAKNKRYRVIFKVYHVIMCTSFFANLKRISITARAYNFCYLLDLSIIS